MYRKGGKKAETVKCKNPVNIFFTGFCRFLLYILVIQTGFEPVTRSLEGCCSIQLSYWTIFQAAKIEIKSF